MTQNDQKNSKVQELVDQFFEALEEDLKSLDTNGPKERTKEESTTNPDNTNKHGNNEQ